MTTIPAVGINQNLSTVFVDPGQTQTFSLSDLLVFLPGDVPNTSVSILRLVPNFSLSYDASPDPAGAIDYMLAGDPADFFGTVPDIASSVTYTNTGVLPVSVASVASIVLFGAHLQYVHLLDPQNPSSGFIDQGSILGLVSPPFPTTPIVVNISDAEVLEGNIGATTLAFSVDLSRPLTDDDLTVNIAAISPPSDPLLAFRNAQELALGIGLGNSDVSLGLLASPTFTFTPQSGTHGTVSVVVNGDIQIEPDEKFTVQIAETHSTTDSVVLGRSTAIGTVRNDDGALATSRTTVSVPSVLDLTIQDYLRQDVAAAVGRIEQSLGAPLPSLEIKFVLQSTGSALAHTGPQLDPNPDSPDFLLPAALVKAKGKPDPNGTDPDMIIEIGSDRIVEAYSGHSTFDMTELLSHEIIHGLGFGAGRPWNTLTDFDQSIYTGPRGLAFAAANGIALRGGGIPLEGGDSGAPGVAHINVDIKDLMNAVERPGIDPVSGLDVAILRDLGYGGMGRAIKGYLQGATVFADENSNGLLDTGEASDRTDGSGNFPLFGVLTPIHAFGGIDISTGLPFKGELSAPSGYSIITPLTTLIALLQAKNITSPAQKVLSALGVTTSPDLTTLDPVAAAKANDSGGAVAEVAAAKVYDTVVLVGSAVGGLGADLSAALKDGFSAIATAIGGAGFSLTDVASLNSLIGDVGRARNVSLSPAATDAIASIIAASNNALHQVAQANPTGDPLLQAVAAIELVIQGAASNAIQQAAGDPAALAAIANAFTGANLDAFVAQAAIDLANQGQNQAPVAFDLSLATNEDTSLSGTLSGADLDTDLLTYSIAAAPVHGALVLNGAKFTYAPALNFNGADSFTFKANDGNLDSALATVSIDINAINDPAVIGGTQSGTVGEDGQLTASGTLTVAEVDTGEASFQPDTIAGGFGTLVLAEAGVWTYTLNNANAAVQALNAGQTLTDAITIRSFDGTEAAVAITINGADEIFANIITGSNRSEVIKGTDQADIITPLKGNDIVKAGAGDDVIKATINDGRDVYDGGQGSDTIDYSALTKSVDVRLSVNNGRASGKQSGSDVLISIENVVGSQTSDRIEGNKFANIIEGAGGNDWLVGGGGTDTFAFFNSGFGKDVITDFDKRGDDVIEFSTSVFSDFAAVQIALIAHHGDVIIETPDHLDSITLRNTAIASLTADDFKFV